jgi:myosin heavy subunit
MGVLESIRVKQENYPYRFKFEDFYRKYELLSSYYSEGRYDLMSEDKKKSKSGEWRERC